MWGPVSSTKFLAASSRLRTELRDRTGSASRLGPALNHGVGCVVGIQKISVENKHRGVLAAPSSSLPLLRQAERKATASRRLFSTSMSPLLIIVPTQNVCRCVQVPWKFLGFVKLENLHFPFPYVVTAFTRHVLSEGIPGHVGVLSSPWVLLMLTEIHSGPWRNGTWVVLDVMAWELESYQKPAGLLRADAAPCEAVSARTVLKTRWFGCSAWVTGTVCSEQGCTLRAWGPGHLAAASGVLRKMVSEQELVIAVVQHRSPPVPCLLTQPCGLC